MATRSACSRAPRGLRNGLGAVALWTALGLRSAAADTFYALEKSYVPQVSGNDPSFFDGWDFWTDADPSHGAVQYMSREDAERAGMIKEEADHAYFGVDMAQTVAEGSGRPSVRIQSKAQYNKGLFIVKIKHAPSGCGTWPAFWMYGEDAEHPWPEWGEYDIVEGIHNQKHAMTTLHTNEQCNQEQLQAGTDFTSFWEHGTGPAAADNCDIHAPGQWPNQGCSQRTPEDSWGESFNNGEGGTFAAEWDPDAGHIRTWFWPSGSEPADVVNHQPQPDSWRAPFSYFSLKPESCAANHFKNMRLVFTLNMCGDLGDPYFHSECPVQAREMSCREMVEKHPEMLSDAFWSIGSLDVYQRQNSDNMVVFAETGHTFGKRPAMQSDFMIVVGACAVVMGLAGVALVVRAELSKNREANAARDDEESRVAMVPEDCLAGDTSGLRRQAGRFLDLIFDGDRRAPAPSHPASEGFSRQSSAGSRPRGYSWASESTPPSEVGLLNTSAAPGSASSLPTPREPRDRSISNFSWVSEAASEARGEWVL